MTPVTAGERIQALDVIRGFALFGILLVNIEAMVGPMAEAIDGLNQSLRGANRIADAAVYILAQGKFYLLFSLLFGMGFMIMLMRAQAAGRVFFRVYLRRLFVLSLIGLAHGLLIWSGDILLAYSLFGLMLLLFFSKTPQSRLPKWGLFFYVGPVVLIFLFHLIGELTKLNAIAHAEFTRNLDVARERMLDLAASEREVYGSRSYRRGISQAAADMGMIWEAWMLLGWQLLGMFLLGAWFARSGAIADPANYRKMFFRMRWVGLPVGLAMMLWSFVIVPSNDMTRMDLEVGVATALMMFANLLMAFGYLSWLVRGLQSPWWSKLLALLAPAGRMALTNYLMQSIIAVLIFYNWGLGYYDQLGRAWQILYVVVLFGMQVAFSHWWLARFRYGPMEWVWRTLTYLRIP